MYDLEVAFAINQAAPTLTFLSVLSQNILTSSPSYIQDLFSTNHIVYNLRVKEFTIPRFNSIHYGKHSLRYLGPVLWAKLPSRVRTLHSLAGFKRAVRGLDLEMLMDDSDCVCMVCNA